MYAKNTLKYGWLEDVKTILFGPSEQLVANDPALKEIRTTADGIACKFISDNESTSESLEQLGLQIEYVGTIIADLIKEGYVPMGSLIHSLLYRNTSFRTIHSINTMDTFHQLP
jgi:hypothetical protein